MDRLQVSRTGSFLAGSPADPMGSPGGTAVAPDPDLRNAGSVVCARRRFTESSGAHIPFSQFTDQEDDEKN